MIMWNENGGSAYLSRHIFGVEVESIAIAAAEQATIRHGTHRITPAEK